MTVITSQRESMPQRHWTRIVWFLISFSEQIEHHVINSQFNSNLTTLISNILSITQPIATHRLLPYHRDSSLWQTRCNHTRVRLLVYQAIHSNSRVACDHFIR